MQIAYSSYSSKYIPQTAEILPPVLDINALVREGKETIYSVRVDQSPFTEEGIHNGDLLFIDPSKEPAAGSLVVVEVGGDHLLRKIWFEGRKAWLSAPGLATMDIEIACLNLLGTVVYQLKKW